MSCNRQYQKSVLNASNVSSQTLNAKSNVVFNTANPYTGCSIDYDAGSSVINLEKSGIYLVVFNADITSVATAGGNAVLQLFNNNIAVSGAEITQTITSNTSISSVSFATIVNVPKSCACVDNTASLVVQNTGAAIVISNANIVVVKLA